MSMVHKRLFTVVTFLLCFETSLLAEQIKVKDAQQIAQSFIQAKSGLRSGNAIHLTQTRYVNESFRSTGGDVAYYVFNLGKNDGFVIVSADDCAYPILGYSTEGGFDANRIAPQTTSWLDNYVKEIGQLIADKTQPTEASKQFRRQLMQGTYATNDNAVILPTALWGQNAPYNLYCPKIRGEQTITGCVATAYAIMMKYYELPKSGKGTHSYTHQQIGNISADFNVVFDWDNMLDNYNSDDYTQEQANAVAQLIYLCGVGVNMDYGITESWAELCPYNMKDLFSLNPGAQELRREGYTDQEWLSLLKKQIDRKQPVIYRGAKINNAGHVFICDGYNDLNMPHFNWGWDGYANGFFSLSALDPERNGGYNYGQEMMYNLVPEAILSTDQVQEVRFGDAMGDEDTQTGISTDINLTDYENGECLTVQVSHIYNVGSAEFVGKLSVGFEDNDGNLMVKEEVAGEVAPGEWPEGYYYGWWKFSIYDLPSPRSDYKLVALYTDENGEWRKIKGGPNITSELPLNGYSDNKSFTITLPTLEGLHIAPLDGYSTNVSQGEDFKFTIETDEDFSSWDIYVSANGNLLVPDGNVYTIENIQDNQVVKVVMENPTSIETIEGAKAYTKEGSLFVYTPEQEFVTVISISGTVINNESQVGLKQYTGLQQGIYIICIGEKKIKVKI